MTHSTVDPEFVFLDVGGVILPDEPFAQAVYEAVNEIRRADGHPLVLLSDFRSLYDSWRNSRPRGSLRQLSAQTWLHGRKTELSAALKSRWRQDTSEPFPDAVRFLRRASERVGLGLIANQPASTRRRLEEIDLLKYFAVIVLSEEVGLEKPDRRIYRYAVEATGLAPARLMHIGNRPDTDAAPAKAEGLRTALVLRGEAPDFLTRDERSLTDFSARDLDEALLRLNLEPNR